MGKKIWGFSRWWVWGQCAWLCLCLLAGWVVTSHVMVDFCGELDCNLHSASAGCLLQVSVLYKLWLFIIMCDWYQPDTSPLREVLHPHVYEQGHRHEHAHEHIKRMSTFNQKALRLNIWTPDPGVGLKISVLPLSYTASLNGNQGI